MKFTYANVMSTIAMFAAVTTGTGYAATQLAANSVTTKQIRNGQVTSADLAPSVRKQLAARPSSGGSTGGGAVGGGSWTDTGLVSAGQQLGQCSADCVADDYGDAGFTTSMGMDASILSTKFSARASGTITNNGSGIQRVTIAVYGGPAYPVVSNNNTRMVACSFELAAGATTDLASCANGATFTSANKKFLRIRVSTTDAASANITSNMKVEVKK